MQNTDYLNDTFGISGKVAFIKTHAGLIFVEIETELVSASICIQGAQVVTWYPKDADHPVLWATTFSSYKPGTPVRGGVPICWPWFGDHPIDSQLPAHGYARISTWNLESLNLRSNGYVELEFRIGDNPPINKLANPPLGASLKIEIGSDLSITLITQNLSNDWVRFTEGFHTYFLVGDVRQVSLEGLDGVEYVDLLDDHKKLLQQGPITFADELGRVYFNSANECVIRDPVLHRKILISKSGSLCTAVWNPWRERAKNMRDIGPVMWQSMLCVEAANAFENAVSLAPSGSHVMSSKYCVESIA